MTERRQHTDSETRSGDEPTTVSRRRLLGSAAGVTVGVGGIGANSRSASATDVTGCDDWLDAPAEYPEVDLTSGNPTASNLDGLEGVAENDDDGDEGDERSELVIYVHGWLGLETSTDQAHTLAQALADTDYDRPVVAASWSADTPNYWRAESAAETAGRRLASWLESDAVPGTGGDNDDESGPTIRLVGHSLGGRVCLETLLGLATDDGNDGDGPLESVALLGTAVDDDSVCTNGRYAYGIDAAANEVFNYHSENDDSVCYGYDLQSLSSGLGCAGADCGDGWFGDDDGARPSNYTDVDVTDAVDDHCAYGKPDVGCVPRIVADFE
ncbi:Alpha/beta hydrolase of unknown function [Halobiforma haloterrestris]|uniref:DUF726 domain-containing protein n=1 Tax=Natronobacterium haloterrestre TaxID=148448 RepID=A0A1I1CX14_NATHA|nr:alpha/beta hydrolase [Halobiforma haloterrestris]SFB67279.1 Alpha/beta hydrolase of unknown function [Halobiforma haloterrestris]